MLTNRQLFLNHVAQTSHTPLMLEIVKASGTSLFDVNGKEYTDLISGIAVSNMGHCHPAIVNSIKNQLDQYMHLMVYGEFVQSPQVKLAKALADLLPEPLKSVYFVNSGTEAVEGALKLAKRYTGRTEIICFRNAYHGSTQGALSLVSDEYFKQAFRPLLPGIKFLNFNELSGLNEISDQTACVVVEMIQGEAGAIPANMEFMLSIFEKCRKHHVLVIVDEIQTGYGRTGSFFAFEHYKVIPDILLLAKGMGGGMPLGAFISSKEIMGSLSENPALGHITTFGGHPVCCAAGLANLELIRDTGVMERAAVAEKMIRQKLMHPAIKEISGKGMMMAVAFDSAATNQAVIAACIAGGVLTDWFLFAPHKMRIAPPLIITDDCLSRSLDIIMESIAKTVN